MGFGSFLFGFTGRINRSRYWLALLVYCVVLFLLLLAIVPLFSDGRGRTSIVLGGLVRISGQPSYGVLPIALTLLINVPLLWSFAATSIKRLHDRNKSGWWLLPMGALPLLLSKLDGIVPDALVPPLAFIACGLFLWLFIECYGLRGTRGANRYGPDPLPKTRRGAIFA